tara:strand:- start:242 stop:1150 length:909 start_codon:yes stop_codon:yes gene_type:complete
LSRKPYADQVKLLLNVIPDVAKEECFALHGGTAINLFVRDMPRLSVDIDLTYLPLEDRGTSLNNISSALERIKKSIEGKLQSGRVIHQQEKSKLQVSSQGANIKIEVNQTMRGALSAPSVMLLCDSTQEEFDAFCEISVVPIAQLYGGKICAALDRQHPRDLFDVKYLLENEGFADEIKEGFLLCLLSSDRPVHEVIFPNLQDQRLAMTNQFTGMSRDEFSYTEFERVREKLIQTIHSALTDADKQFLIGFNNAEPDWSIYNFEKFPAVQWKLQHLNKFKTENSEKHAEQLEILKHQLNIQS